MYVHSIIAEELLILSTVSCYLNMRESALRSAGAIAGY